MGIMAGLAGGIGIVVVLDAMDHSVKSSKAIRGLGLPVLAIIPKIQSDQQVQREKMQDSILYGIAVLYMLCILAIVAVEAMGLTHCGYRCASVGRGCKAAVKGIF